MKPVISTVHSHRCGFDPATPNHGKGCAHIFTHEAPVLELPLQAVIQAHACPACGRGPWTSKWAQALEDKHNEHPERAQHDQDDTGQLMTALIQLLKSL